MSMRGVLVTVAASLLVLAGCGSSGGGDAGGSDSGDAATDARPGDADVGGGDAGADDGGAGDGAVDGGADGGPDADAGGDAGSIGREGVVTVTTSRRTVTEGSETFTLESYRAWAGFYEVPASSRETIGPCVLEPSDPSTVEEGESWSAGAITITGGSAGVTLSPDSSEGGPGYRDVSGSALLWEGGETLTFAAEGATEGVPGFSGTVTAPVALAPSGYDETSWPDEGGDVTLSRSAAHTFTWPSGLSGEVRIRFQPLYYGDAVCHFDAAAGSGTVPVEVFAAMADMEGIELSLVSRQQVTVGDFQVVLEANRDSGAFRALSLVE